MKKEFLSASYHVNDKKIQKGNTVNSKQ